MIFKHFSPFSDNGNVIYITFLCVIDLFSQTLHAAPCPNPVASVQSVQGQVMWSAKDETNWSAVKLNDLFCPGDRIRVGKTGRTSILLNDETLIRLAENSTILLSDHQESDRNWLKLLNGVAHFISRVQNNFRINTPYVNAFIEGTEFTVAVTTNRAFVTVLEGRVAAVNNYGEVKLKGGQKAVAYDGQAPIVEQVVDPLDAVKWTLYYPPLIDNPATSARSPAKPYHLRDIQDTLIDLVQNPNTARDPAMIVYRASLHLRVGGEEAARNDLARALRLEPDHPEALALMSVIATVHNQPTRALELALKAQDKDPQSLAALLALSYAKQALFSLPEALEAAKQATRAAPQSVLAWSQLARLQLMFRNLDEATDAARKAVDIAPQTSQTHTTLGFVHLAGLKIDAARRAFEKAIELDRSAAPLPRFGLGLVQIRKGDLQEGRRQLEIAANLDPGNAMIRSYLGKAYYEEKRNCLAETQFKLSKQFDENDPTPWFYSAILQQSQNRPVDALNELQSAIDLNDNRAVYRSRFLLDQDEAARDAGQARVYQDLGFEQLARREAYKSLQISPQNHSAHRLLADSYNGDPFLEKARMSEMLQSQLLQPLSSNPIQPQLAATGLGILDGAGPSDAGYAEFTPLFTRNGLNLQLNAIGGSDSTVGDDLILSGLHDRVAFSLGQFHYQSDGWRENNDLEQDIYNAFFQVALTPTTSIQYEYRRHDKQSGDLDLKFDPDEVNLYERNRLARRVNRVGLLHKLPTNGHMVASVIGQELKARTGNYDMPFPTETITDGTNGVAADVYVNSRMDYVSKSALVELQLIQPIYEHAFIFGGGHFHEDSALTTSWWSIIHPHSPDIEPYYVTLSPPTTENIDPVFNYSYLYSYLELPAHLNLTLGLSYEDFDSETFNIKRTNPKFGLIWEPLGKLSFQMAYIESIIHPNVMDQSIEPTQVAGFNQHYHVGEGAELQQTGFGFDAKLNNKMSIGADYSFKDFKTPFHMVNESDTYISVEHKLSSIYLNWAPINKLGVSVAYEYDDVGGSRSPYVTKTKRLPIGVNYHWPSGFFLKTEGIHIDQKVKNLKDQHDQDNFWKIDFIAGYRFPKRYGKVEFIVNNLLDKSFKYNDAGYNNNELATPPPQYQPERQLLLRFSLDF
jgi:tetratricopeptide (TPR) repeat protein